MRFGVVRPFVALGSLLAIACGGAVRSDLVSDDPSFGNLTDAAVPADASVTADAGSPPRTDSGTTPVLDATAPADAGVVVADSGVVVVDAGRDAGAPVRTFRCGAFDAGATSCTSGSEDCCADIPTTGRASYSCEARGDCNSNDVALECANSADCTPGSVCCGFFSQTYGWESVSCLPAAQCVGSATLQATLMCNPFGVNSCPTGRSCQASSRLTGYGYCQ